MECIEFSFFGTCAQAKVTHWSARAYRYFDVGFLMSLLVFSQRGVGDHLGPFYLIQISIVQVGCLKVASTTIK